MLNITSISNPLIREIKGLNKKRERWKKGLFLIEGIKIIEECIDNGHPVVNIIYSDRLFDIGGGKDFFNKIKTNDKLVRVSDKLYRHISNVENPQGVLAIVKFEASHIRNMEFKDAPFFLLLDRVQDPGNMGTIIRTADAFGVDGVIIMGGCVDVYNPKVIRSTMGSIFRVPIYHEMDREEIIYQLKRKNVDIYSASLEGSRYIQTLDFTKGCAFIIGNESTGVSRELHDLADELIKIPMLGEIESLNVAIASSIIMYEVMRQRIQ